MSNQQNILFMNYEGCVSIYIYIIVFSCVEFIPGVCKNTLIFCTLNSEWK